MPSNYFDFSFAEAVASLEQGTGAGYTFDPFTFSSLENDTITENIVRERTLAGFFAFDGDTEFNGMPLYFNAGIRYEHTEVSAEGKQTVPLGVRQFTPTEFRIIQGSESQFVGSEINPAAGDGYNLFLPNLDLRLDVTEDFVTRFSYSRTAARANLGTLVPAISIGAAVKPGSEAASGGNPDLLPLQSDNFDISLEYYYDEGSYVSAGYFKKFVQDFVVSGTDRRELFDLGSISEGPRTAAACAVVEAGGGTCTDDAVWDQLTLDYGIDASNPLVGVDGTAVGDVLDDPSDPNIQFLFNTSVNGQSAEFEGFEFALQHNFWDTGFGLFANYTIVNGGANFDLRATTNQFAITGLSDSYNIVGYYDKDGLNVRVAYNWRDDFLSALNQGQQAVQEPQFTEAFGQLDFSVSYEINDTFKVFADGLNLTDSVQRIHGRYENQLLNARQFGPRFTLGVTAAF